MLHNAVRQLHEAKLIHPQKDINVGKICLKEGHSMRGEHDDYCSSPLRFPALPLRDDGYSKDGEEQVGEDESEQSIWSADRWY
ncbi:unnamed protein product [Gongylonema pulchrum]|uniref:Uncharacterized protein n=1 Tax=Gongylonema pulchrum TaxID=637853 RepID=A0A183DA84_9BILA|nr:unnamed protein product [Gongylonema pulchrum]